MRVFFLISVPLLLAGCANGPLSGLLPERDGAPPAATEDQTRPVARDEAVAAQVTTAAPRPPAAARTVEEFDTTSAAERQAAAAAPEPQGERRLGETVTSLGDVARPGFWLETPLVSTPVRGRVYLAATGKSAQVDLIPIDGPTTAGSRISLAAMRLIEAPLTDLPTIEVFTGG